MKLLTCHIENFGKLHDLDLDFRQGLHTVFEENSWGKSTLADYLRVMFYGFAGDKKRKNLENERKRFAPWQSGVYGGSITFEAAGRHIRMDRIFGTKDASEDTLEAYDAETNLSIEGFPEVPGEHYFAIDRESFSRTVFIGQQDCATEATSGIQAKIGHLEEETADMSDFADVKASLKKKMDELSPTRLPGKVKVLTQEVAALESEIDRRAPREEALARVTESLEAHRAQKNEVDEQIEELTEQFRHLSVAKEVVQYAALSEPEEARLRDLEMVFAEGTPSGQDLADAEDCLQEIRRLRTEYENITIHAPREERPEAKRNSPIGILALILIASGVMAFFLYGKPWILVSVAGVLLVLLKDRYDKKHGVEDPETVVKDPVNWETMRRAMRSGRDLDDARRAIRAVEEELLGFLQRYVPDLTREDDLSRAFFQLQHDMDEYQALREKEERAQEATMAYQNDRNANAESLWHVSGEENAVETPEEIRAAIEESKKQQSHLAQVLREEERQAEDLRRELDQLMDMEEEKEVKSEELEISRHTYDVLKKTSAYLDQARAAFTARYMEPIKEGFDAYYTMLTGKAENDYQLDADLDIKIREFGSMHETGFLSEGTQDLIGLCRRMAMVDAMYEEERPFLIMDDPFVNLDSDKMRFAMQFLQKIAETYQVLYFTCHESRVP